MADVDVVIPVRNGGRLLATAVESVLVQAGPDVRVIVVDDGSSDGAVDRLPSHPRLMTVRNAGVGIPAALNTGISAGSARYIARQDADDESMEGRLQVTVEHLEANPGIGLVSTGFEVVVGDRTVSTLRPDPSGMLVENPVCAGSTVVRREVSAAAGHYRSTFRLASDYDMWLRCAWVAGITVLPEVTYRYRLTADMSTIRRRSLQLAYADLARASARSRIDGRTDPVDDFVPPPEDVTVDVELDVWWAREFAALGARRDAFTCTRRAFGRLPAGRRWELLTNLVRRPQPQAVWQP